MPDDGFCDGWETTPIDAWWEPPAPRRPVSVHVKFGLLWLALWLLTVATLGWVLRNALGDDRAVAAPGPLP